MHLHYNGIVILLYYCILFRYNVAYKKKLLETNFNMVTFLYVKTFVKKLYFILFFYQTDKLRLIYVKYVNKVKFLHIKRYI